jgi:ABC-type amino acid transport substrate-binding protein/serine phosphatase RsbU (regulator of sigma subunit)
MLFTIIFIFFSTTLFGDGFFLTTAEKRFIEGHPIIYLAGEKNSEPFTIGDEVEVNGYDAELLDLIEQESGLKFEIILGTPKEVIDMTENRRVDGVLTNSNFTKRNKLHNPSIPYSQFLPYVIVKDSNPKEISRIEDLEGKILAIEKDNPTFYNIAKDLEIDFGEIKYYENIFRVIKAIISGEADFTIFDEKIFYLAKTVGLSNHINTKFSVGEPFDAQFWFRKDYPELKRIVDKAVRNIDKDVMSNLRKKWFNEGDLVSNRILFTKEELDFIRNNPVLKLTNDPDYPPYEFRENNKAVGYSIDFMQLLSKKIGIKFEFVSDTWEELIEMFCRGEIDIIHSTDKSERVSECAIFSTPFIKDSSQFLTRSDFLIGNSIEDYFGYTMASPKTWEQTEFFKEKYKGKIKVVETETILEAIEMVRKGEVDFTYDYGNVLNYLVMKNGYKGLKIQGVGYIDENFLDYLYVGVPKDKKILLSIINKAIFALSTKELNELSKKWLSFENLQRVDFSFEEKDFLFKKGALKMCVNKNRMPYEGIDSNGEHTGITADILNLIYTNSNLNIEIIPSNSISQTLHFLKTKRCDFSSLGMETENRKYFANFTKPYMSFPIVIATDTSETIFIDDAKYLFGKTVSILRNSSFVDIFRNQYPKIDIVEVDSIEEGLNTVRKGQSFGYIDLATPILLNIQNSGISDIKISGQLNLSINWSIASRNDEEILNDIFQKALDFISFEDKQKIFNKWISIKFEDRIDYTLFYNFIGLMFIIGIIVFWRLREARKFSRRIQHKNIELHRSKFELEKNHKKTQDSINYALRIQEAILPDEIILTNYFYDFFVIWKPKDTVGGDIYFFIEYSDDEVFVIIIDGAGHGVSGAFVTMLVKAVKAQIFAEIRSGAITKRPGEILKQFNIKFKKILKQEKKSSIGFDGGILYLNRTSKSAIFSGAKIDLFIMKQGKIKILKPERKSVGFDRINITQDYKEYEIELETGDELYLATDGIFDQESSKDKKFGKQNFLNIIKKVSGASMEMQKSLIESKFKEFKKGVLQNDDVTIIGLKI